MDNATQRAPFAVALPGAGGYLRRAAQGHVVPPATANNMCGLFWQDPSTAAALSPAFQTIARRKSHQSYTNPKTSLRAIQNTKKLVALRTLERRARTDFH
jgi:hypothetical protein